ncbi:MAG: hypothetical protein AAF317_01485, partial [Pseudomonadota bacterium]
NGPDCRGPHSGLGCTAVTPLWYQRGAPHAGHAAPGPPQFRLVLGAQWPVFRSSSQAFSCSPSDHASQWTEPGKAGNRDA